MTYSNRCFPTKAVAVWRATNDSEHAQLVGAYFNDSGNWQTVYARDASPSTPGADPLYVVWSHRSAEGIA